ncbi:hypothetical protein NOJ05_19645 [Neorhizobium galegae]|uniref:hypothetical protein n=1 Tax=Neorhizobium galegae TaxID=399 RepID=UPI002105F0A7|nr:hypothetical protein [Neorhizobium galegae]MCQ1779426.1 hypothetical protein [Neorhizobium galegae]MCQ1795586.1 hypothetical protein [Neorhizobium galegae]
MSTAAAQTKEPDYSGSYICKLKASAGLKVNKDSKAWSGTIFNVTNQSLLMKVTATGRTGSTQFHPNYPKYGVSFKDFGSAEKANECVNNFNSDKYSKDVPIIDGRLECQFFGTSYRVNLKTNKVQVYFDGGYMDDDQENTDTPYVAVGVCDKVS